jgi:phage baseplate assembly protein W
MILESNLPGPAIGWPLFPRPDASGQLHFPSLAESVRENLQVILSTRPGEQLRRLDYGAGLTDFIGKPDSIAVRSRIVERVTESIRRWEQRLLLDRVDVQEQAGHPGILRVEIAYRLRRTGEAGTLGVRLELNP